MSAADIRDISDRLKVLKDALVKSYPSKVVENFNIGSRTTYRVGGNAAVTFVYGDCEELDAVSKILDECEVPIFVLGAGSNVLISDKGFAGLCLIADEKFKRVKTQDADTSHPLVKASGSVMLPSLARKLAALGISGFQWAVGIPGTVGGSIKTNAGGHGSQTVNTLVEVEIFDLGSGLVKTVMTEDLDLRYRFSNLANNQVVMSATHKLEIGDSRELKREIGEIVKWRRENQPGGQNAGSVFVNPPDRSAGQIIDELGLKSYRIGTAEVSSKHGNFIQADKNGKASDVYSLINYLIEIVKDKTGYELKPELKLIGFN